MKYKQRWWLFLPAIVAADARLGRALGIPMSLPSGLVFGTPMGMSHKNSAKPQAEGTGNTATTECRVTR
ncbi:hypothetical protein SKAU_G00201960 [Synaphobranchus kaupii]|uniref:Secreted protein n=1 Tax=Synaphobranchus kaupii TaxID=118154 RepID=A0A9Q1FFM6_SYNKA|nr:hypothetical protein SKAU_G00201960 [Synaphobranchus kaupii]